MVYKMPEVTTYASQCCQNIFSRTQTVQDKVVRIIERNHFYLTTNENLDDIKIA